MEFRSVAEVKEAERLSKVQRLGFTHLLRSKVASPKDMILLQGARAAAAERSEAFNTMLRDRAVNRPFNDGAIYFKRIRCNRA